MIVELPFGEQTQSFDTDDFGPRLRIAGRYCCSFPPALTQNEIALKIVNGLKHLSHLFDKPKILTIVNDSYRRTPTAFILSMVWDYISKSDFIVATGSHRLPTDLELSEFFGEHYSEARKRLFIHDCHDNDSVKEIGKTSRETVVYVNRKALEADLIFAINSVEPHFFAGYTGGRKSLIPGLASFETIMANHSMAKDIDSCDLNLQTNKLHLDLEEGVQLLRDKPILSIQCVTDRDGNIIDLFAGDMRMTFYQACESAEKYYTVPVPKKFDIAIASGDPPLDINLYQLQKAQEHGGRIVKDGGVLIVVGACPEGAGSKYFMELAGKYPSAESVLKYGLNDDSFGIHKLVKTARQLQKFKIFYVTTLDDSEVRKVYFEPFKDLSAALVSATKEIEGDIEVGILEDAGYTVPVIKP
jgi:nickel-dependent lactate racemase